MNYEELKLMAGKKGKNSTSSKPAAVPYGGRQTEDYISFLNCRKNPGLRLRRRLREIYADLGGEDRLSLMQKSLVERFVNIEVWQAGIEARLAGGENMDELIGSYLLSVTRTISLARTLGLKRQARDVTLESYVAGKYGDS